MNFPLVFGALADPTRLDLVRELAEGPKTATQLFTRLAISQPRASRHLRILREAGLVRASRRGRWVEFGLAEDPEVSRLVLFISGKEPAATAGHTTIAPRPARASSSAKPPGEPVMPPRVSPRSRPAAPDIEEFLL